MIMRKGMEKEGNGEVGREREGKEWKERGGNRRAKQSQTEPEWMDGKR